MTVDRTQQACRYRRDHHPVVLERRHEGLCQICQSLLTHLVVQPVTHSPLKLTMLYAIPPVDHGGSLRLSA